MRAGFISNCWSSVTSFKILVLDFTECRGQECGGAAVMNRQYTGVQNNTLVIHDKALYYIHCGRSLKLKTTFSLHVKETCIYLCTFFLTRRWLHILIATIWLFVLKHQYHKLKHYYKLLFLLITLD